MSIISLILDIAYIPLIFLIMNMVSIGIIYRDKLFLKLIPITLIISIIIGNILPDRNIPNVDDFPQYRSVCEVISFAINSTFFSVYLLRKRRYYTANFIAIVFIPFQFIPFFNVIIYEYIGILSFVIAFREYKKNSDDLYGNSDAFAGFLSIYIILSIAVLFCIDNINWKGIIPDLRHDNIIYIKNIVNKGENKRENIYYYELRNVEMTEDKMNRMNEIVDNGECGTYIFIKDMAAAYTLKRNSISCYEESISLSNDVETIVIHK